MFLASFGILATFKKKKSQCDKYKGSFSPNRNPKVKSPQCASKKFEVGCHI
jgi:hypothetical protein